MAQKFSYDVEVLNIHIPGLIDKLEEIENRTETCIVISSPSPTIPHDEELVYSNSRKFTIVGENLRRVKLAKKLVLRRIVEFDEKEAERLSDKEIRVHVRPDNGKITYGVRLDRANLGKLIGKCGENIKSLENRTNTKIVICTEPDYTSTVTCKVYGSNVDNQRAASINLLLQNQYFNWINDRLLSNLARRDDGLKFEVRSIYAGGIIGKSGHNLKKIEEATNTRIFTPQQREEDAGRMTKDKNDKIVFTVYGHNSQSKELAAMCLSAQVCLIRKQNKKNQNQSLENTGIDTLEVKFEKPKLTLIPNKVNLGNVSAKEYLVTEEVKKDDRNISRQITALRRLDNRRERTLPKQFQSDLIDKPFSCPLCCKAFSCPKLLTKHIQGKSGNCEDFRMEPSEKELNKHKPGNLAFEENIGETRYDQYLRPERPTRQRTMSLPQFSVVPTVRTRYYSVTCIESEIIIGPPADLLELGLPRRVVKRPERPQSRKKQNKPGKKAKKPKSRN